MADDSRRATWCLASMISLGSGFRGGLFFAALLLGSLGGQLFAAGLNAVGVTANADAYAIIGLSAVAVSVIGGLLPARRGSHAAPSCPACPPW